MLGTFARKFGMDLTRSAGGSICLVQPGYFLVDQCLLVLQELRAERVYVAGVGAALAPARMHVMDLAGQARAQLGFERSQSLTRPGQGLLRGWIPVQEVTRRSVLGQPLYMPHIHMYMVTGVLGVMRV